MSKIKFSDGVVVDTSGPPRILTLKDGHYVVGSGMLIPVGSLNEANSIISNMNAI